MKTSKLNKSGFKFDDSQEYQLDAISSVVDLFDGQPKDVEKLVTTMRGAISVDFGDDELEGVARQAARQAEQAAEIGALGNNLILDRGLILANMQRVQDRNGLEVAAALAGDALDFDIEMETGTGKTYVYLRTIFDLAVRYNFTKFVILVPNDAIREGVSTSIRLMREHFERLYTPHGITFDASVYSGKNADVVRPFATSTNVQILIMPIKSMREDVSKQSLSAQDEGHSNDDARLIINRARNTLGGFRPIDFIRSTNPIVIMDEPQNMESGLSLDALERLQPALTLRYSATHKKQRNVVYRLDPVDAHCLELVKQIDVAEVAQQGSDATPYIKLVEVRREPTWLARLELSCRKADGSLERRVVGVKQHQELSDMRLTKNPVYEGWRINEMSIEPAYVDLTSHGTLYEGDAIGAPTAAIYKEMIRETVREHLRKEATLRPKGIKVLSLFFVDKVASYLGDGSNNENANGDFVQWFDEVFIEERAKSARYQELLPQAPGELRRAYFAQIKKGVPGDTSGVTKKDNDAYELIMQHEGAAA